MNENGGADEVKTVAGTPAPDPSAEAEGKPAEEPNTIESTEEEPPQGKFAQFLARLRKPEKPSRDAKSNDRMRGLVILLGATVACLFLFFGLFTTESGSSRKERRTQPSLGRPVNPTEDALAANRSPVPQLSVNPQSNEEHSELTEKDLLGTMRNRGGTTPPEGAPAPSSSAKRSPSPAIGSLNFDDPALAEAYRRQGLFPPTARAAEATDWNQAMAENQARQKPNPPAPATAATPVANLSESLRKSSIVFVRTSLGSSASAVVPTLDRKAAAPALAPQGTALVARLQYAASSAAKVPVLAVIEYNYEDEGRLIIPAGTKAYGELGQATQQGWVSIKFHALEFPNGETEKINASALSMERGPLKGDVSGRNTGKRLLTRALTGMGTFAAYAVGGRGLNSTLDNSVLLRERIASNVALAGEQEMQRLAFQQNIVVTVPAKTRFYMILHEAGISGSASDPANSPAVAPRSHESGLQQAALQGGLSDQELRELRQLRDEMRQMNRLMQMSPPQTNPEPENR
jgi:hypothetical protein